MKNLFQKVNYILEKKHKTQMVWLFMTIVIGSILELIGLSAILPLINVIMEPEIVFEDSMYVIFMEILHLQSVTDFIIYYAVALCIIFVVKNIFLIFSKRYQIKVTQSISKSISMRLMDCYMHQEYLFHVSHNVAELQRNITSDVKRYTLTLSMLMNLTVEGITCFFLLVFLLCTDIVTTLLIAGILGAFGVAFILIYKKVQVKYGIISRDMGVQLNKWLLQSFGGIKEIKVLNREHFFLGNYEKAYQKSLNATVNSELVSSLPKYIMEAICMGSLLLVIIIRVSQGEPLDEFVNVLMVFAVAAIRMLPAFNRITGYFGILLFNKVGVDGVYNDLQEMEYDREKVSVQKNKVGKLELNDRIQVENLTFGYPGNEEKIFQNANLTIEKNSSVAFVGSSGAGKTTLADIIIGVLKPEGGDIKVDGQSVFDHLDAWHKTIGYIPQMIYLMDDTIRNNIVFGIEEDKIDDDKVWEALEQAELADFVRTLKDGIYTEIGDRGVRLSGGQRQRIGIARALYTEPDVLVLDEATSALDNETEAAVMESIEHLQGKTTMIIIAHRLTTIQNCDKVYEVGNGEIKLKRG